MATELANHINFNGPEWTAIKTFLLQMRDMKVQLLIGSKSHDESNLQRGEIRFIDTLLSHERTALMAAQNGR